MSTTEAAVRSDGRVILDVNVSADHVTSIGAMNGHEGDNGRVIPFVLVKNQSGQGSKPYNLENKTIDLVGTDSTGINHKAPQLGHSTSPCRHRSSKQQAIIKTPIFESRMATTRWCRPSTSSSQWSRVLAISAVVILKSTTRTFKQ